MWQGRQNCEFTRIFTLPIWRFMISTLFPTIHKSQQKNLTMKTSPTSPSGSLPLYNNNPYDRTFISPPTGLSRDSRRRPSSLTRTDSAVISDEETNTIQLSAMRFWPHSSSGSSCSRAYHTYNVLSVIDSVILICEEPEEQVSGQ